MNLPRPWDLCRRLLAGWLALLVATPLCCCGMKVLAKAASPATPSCCALADEAGDTGGRSGHPEEPCEDCSGKDPRLADGGQPAATMAPPGHGSIAPAPSWPGEPGLPTAARSDRCGVPAVAVGDRRPPGWRLSHHCSRLI